jgi:molybdopterin-biosynthesis enzyme MoeA-like protein
MVDWLLETKYKDLKDLAPVYEKIITIFDARESDLIDKMNELLSNYPGIKLSSLPMLGQTPLIEFSLRGDKVMVEAAMQSMISFIEGNSLLWK